jgi:CoA:oxalate CoA-transferase
MKRAKHLKGLKILDFSAVYAGPICARLLGDCGAEIIKVEAPGMGDVIRGPNGYSRVFAHFNAGKRSIAIDLKTPDGQKLALDLMADADVVVENFRPGVMQRFGLDYDSIKSIYPTIIYCSISGFGQTGPFVHRAAYAPIAHAASGFDLAHLASQDDPNAKPPVWGIMVADMLTGAFAFGSIQTALLGRIQSGKGEHIDVTMMESMMMLIPGQIQAAQIKNAPVGGNFHPITVRDGYVMVCIVTSKNMRCLCDAMQRKDLLEDPRFLPGERWKNIGAFIVEIESWSKTLSADECEARLNDAGVPCSTYNTPDALFTHPQTLARNSFQELEDANGHFLIQNAPFQFLNTDISTATTAASLGQHTDQILSEKLRLTGDAIEALRQNNIVA